MSAALSALPKPLVEYIALESVSDGSYIAPTQDQHVAEVAKELETDLTKAIRANQGLTKTCKGIARHIMDIAVSMRTAAGHPVFNFGNAPEVFAAIVGAESDPSPTSVYGRVFATVEGEERRQLLGRIRAYRDRVLKEFYIVTYVLEQQFPPDSEARKALGELHWDSSPNKAGNPAILADPPSALKKAVAAEYKAANLEVPEKFGGSGKKSKNTTKAEKDKAPAEAMESGIKAVSALAPAVAAFDLYRLVSAFAALIEDPEKRKDVTNRPEAVQYLQTASEVAMLAAKLLDGKATPADVEKLTSLRFNSERDVIPATVAA